MTEVIIKSKSDKNYQNEISTGSHTLVSDIPEKAGGQNSGPNPHELLLGSLGACTSITLQMFARKREWDLKQVIVKVAEETIDDPKDPTKKLHKITRNIEVQGKLTQEQLDTLKTIADKCQIHKLLVGSKDITTNIKEATAV